jgi:glycine/D-amino acid oxidase-like deaminating enzyme
VTHGTQRERQDAADTTATARRTQRSPEMVRSRRVSPNSFVRLPVCIDPRTRDGSSETSRGLMIERHDAVVIGGGHYGLRIALHLWESWGLRDVLVLEAEPKLMSRASYANQARVHNGYHYPGSILTESGGMTGGRRRPCRRSTMDERCGGLRVRSRPDPGCPRHTVDTPAVETPARAAMGVRRTRVDVREDDPAPFRVTRWTSASEQRAVLDLEGRRARVGGVADGRSAADSAPDTRGAR